MIFFFGKPVAEPSSNAIQARRTMARSNLELQIAPSPLLRYGLAAVSVSVALGGSLLLERFHFRNVADPLFLFAIAVAVWYAGTGPAILAVVLSGLADTFFFILTLSGVAGKLFAPLGIAYIFSVLASLVVALTITPALSMLLLGHRRIRATEPAVVIWSKKRYSAALARIEQSPRLVISSVVVLTILGVAALPFFSTSFLPELREGHYIVHMQSVPGSSLEDSLRVGREVAGAPLKLSFVRSVA
jgi:hypothetical protein